MKAETKYLALNHKIRLKNVVAFGLQKPRIFRRSNIDYALVEAQTVYGKIGIKVWICRGEIYGKVDLSPVAETEKRGRGGDRGSRGGRERRRRNN